MHYLVLNLVPSLNSMDLDYIVNRVWSLDILVSIVITSTIKESDFS